VFKDAAELAQLQVAIDVLDRCLADVLRRAEPGLTERQVARMVEIYLLEEPPGDLTTRFHVEQPALRFKQPK